MIEWQKEYCMGVELIDQQHEELFQAVNRLLHILEDEDDDRSRRGCAEAIKYLKTYTIQHFEDEEAFQMRIGYRGYIHHKQVHDDFRRTIVIQEAMVEAQNYSRDAVRNFVRLLTAWLIEHVTRDDQDIVRQEGEA